MHQEPALYDGEEVLISLGTGSLGSSLCAICEEDHIVDRGGGGTGLGERVFVLLLLEGGMELVEIGLVPLVSHAERLVALVVDAQGVQHLLLLLHYAVLLYYYHRVYINIMRYNNIYMNYMEL